MKKYSFIIGACVLVKLLIQVIGNRNYGFHRDELLHLSVGQHLDWGYMEFPPVIGWIGGMATWFFGDSLLGIRLFPTLAGVALLMICCLIAIEFGGKKGAVFIAGLSVLAFLPFYRNHTLFQPVAFDQLWWITGFYLLIRYLRTQAEKYLVLTGVVLGIGIMTKFTMVFWAFGMFVGLLFYNNGRLFKSKWVYLSGTIAMIICLPYLLWQIFNEFPLLQHLQALRENQLDDIPWWQFGLDQLEFPLTFSLSLIGLYGLLKNKSLIRFRPLAIAAMVIFFTLWILKSKSYYVFALYPVLFAAGAVQVEAWLKGKEKWAYAIGVFILLPSVYFIPEATPILSIENYISYMEWSEDQSRYELTGDYADMFGWEEQVRLVDSLYQSLEKEEKDNCVIWAENYGEAGAVKILGTRYGLPDPISRHGSFWTWGYGDPTAKVWISLGNEAGSVHHVFEDVTLIKTIYHKFAIDEENGIPLYLCRTPRVDIPTWWNNYRDHIFD